MFQLVRAENWLSDDRLCDFLRVVIDKYQQSTDEQVKIKCFYPCPIDIITRTLLGKCKDLKQYENDGLIILPPNVICDEGERHWILFIIDSRFSPGRILKFDSFGPKKKPTHSDKQLDNTLRQRYHKYQWHVLKERVQYDGWACGIWCTLFLEFFLKCKDPTKFTFKKTGIFTNASNHANKVSNAYAIKRYGLAIEEIIKKNKH